ncbi:glycosyltransferase family 2 protein [Wenzhouxiangella limi]|uniref:Glycosyltransferase family 2 protein n=1 Tax=Wenzhouxiangella limi TaxID=2707351 RepID=A0A845V534_9GAMM|nr:glycosyltransferase family A protein [Wenzhouxiangella limi]NDY96296.1 glycosyltransferase family 2 protein [Wenzhouxiangella limi]
MLSKRLKSWLHAQLKLPRPPGFFSPRWYLSQYPDVARSGENAWAHFHAHGRHEGRFAAEDHVALWFDESVFDRVRQAYLRDRAKLEPLDRDYLCWLIARWYALHERWADVIATLQDADFERDLQKQSPFRHLPALLEADALVHTDQLQVANKRLQWLEAAYPDHADVALLRANYLRAAADDRNERRAAWLAHLNDWYARHGLLPLKLKNSSASRMDALLTEAGRPAHGPLVSVLMAAYNAQSTVDTALQSLLSQTYQDLEIIVVDDGSDDQTAAAVEAVAAQDARVKLLQPEQPGGPYAARNHALNAATGEFITVHDADDWSHPQKIERQMTLMQQQPELKGCFSNWVRTTPELMFGGWGSPSAWIGWVRCNTSSLLIRRAVFDTLGYWDELRCSCDAEYVSRIYTAWGMRALSTAMPEVPLAFARSEPNSLTRVSETHLMTKLKGLRHDYHRAHAHWHASAKGIADLYMPQSPQKRPFPVADAMLPKRGASGSD